MDNRSEAPRAYLLFLEETARHVQEWLAFCEHPPAEPEAFHHMTIEAARRAHMVKGGAGFFALDGIVAIARELEADFKQLQAPVGLTDIRPKVEKLRLLLEQCS